MTSAIEALFLLGNDAYFGGRWDEVPALTDEGLALCQTHDYPCCTGPAYSCKPSSPATGAIKRPAAG